MKRRGFLSFLGLGAAAGATGAAAAALPEAAPRPIQWGGVVIVTADGRDAQPQCGQDFIALSFNNADGVRWQMTYTEDGRLIRRLNDGPWRYVGKE